MTEDKIAMTYGSYLEKRGLLPLGEEDLDTQGYLLEREDGALVWQPKRLTFGDALVAVKQGKRIARVGWNGKGMFVYLVAGTEPSVDLLRGACKKAYDYKYRNDEAIPGEQKICAHLDMMAADGSIVIGWLASQTDLLAEDWMILA